MFFGIFEMNELELESGCTGRFCPHPHPHPTPPPGHYLQLRVVFLDWPSHMCNEHGQSPVFHCCCGCVFSVSQQLRTLIS